ATAANFGGRSAENVELQVSVGNLDQPSQTLRELTTRQRASVDLEVEFFRAGSEGVRVELPPDGVAVDNVRYATADVSAAIRVLIVDGEPSPDPYDDEVTFLATALRPEGEVFSGNEAVVVDEAGLDEANLSGFHVVVLANVYRISEPAVEALERFVRRGGGLLVFLGDQVDADLFNGAFYRDGDGLLPAELTQIIRAPDASHLIVTDRLHPAMRGLSRAGDPLGIGDIGFYEYFGCVPYEGEQEDAPKEPDEGAPPTSAAQAARVVARFDDAGGHPAIVERAFGRGRVTMVTTTADKEWHHWADHPTYLPVMMELVRHAARPSDRGSGLAVGQPIELAVDPAEYEPDALIRTPAYPDEREVSVTAGPAPDGRGLLMRWDHTESAGIYQFVMRKREGGETIRLVAVNVEGEEGDLAPADEGTLRGMMGEIPFDYMKGVAGLSGGTGEARTELWRLVLFAVAGVLMCEQVLAWRWGRRRG
ncbi:MAG: hypothetical protein ACE5EX_06000, partial [Phycisphaerae bacterium]